MQFTYCRPIYLHCAACRPIHRTTTCSRCRSSPGGTDKEIENELARAVVSRDYASLRRIEADGYMYTDADAKVNTRNEFIAARTARPFFQQLRI